jgi:hypothetical protein
MRPHSTPSEPIAKDVYIAAPPHIVYDRTSRLGFVAAAG